MCRMVLEGALFREYFKKVEVSNFEVASDAFQTFKDILTRHKALVATYLQGHYDEVRPASSGSCSDAPACSGSCSNAPLRRLKTVQQQATPRSVNNQTAPAAPSMPFACQRQACRRWHHVRI